MKNSLRRSHALRQSPFVLQLAGVAALAVTLGGCPNVDTVDKPSSFLDYPNVLSVKPVEIGSPSVAPYTSGRALAVTESARLEVSWHR